MGLFFFTLVSFDIRHRPVTLIFFFYVQKMELTTMQISLEANQQKYILFGNFLQLQIILTRKQRKAEPRMLVVFFVKIYSLVAALPEPLHISWRVLSWAKSK
jgi:hypothetical protein